MDISMLLGWIIAIALIISGIIDDRYDEILPYITEHWHIIEERVAGPWHTFALEKL